MPVSRPRQNNGIVINYRVDGPQPNEAPQRPDRGERGRALEGWDEPQTIVLSHSLATNLDMWEPQIASLSRRYRLLRYDTRGHGGSEAPDGPYMMETLVEDVRTLLVELGIPSVHFIGLSLGGMIGQLLAATYPAMISALVLCDTSCRTDATAGSMWDERIAVARMRGMEPHVEPTIARWFTPHFVAEHPEVVDSVREMIRRTDPKGYMGCGHAVKTFDAADLLCCIKAPTLVLVGEDDPGTPVDAAREIKDRISSSQLVVLPSASHLSNLEQPEAFNRAVAAFLQSVDEQV